MKTKFDDFVGNGYKITQDDYNYFEGIIEDDILPNQDIDSFKEGLRNDREKWITLLLNFAKHHWVLGDGKAKDFPKKELTQVANEVVDKYLKKK